MNFYQKPDQSLNLEEPDQESESKPPGLADLTPPLLEILVRDTLIIPLWLWGHLNHHFQDVLPILTQSNVYLKNVSNIPELVTDEVDDNERDLKTFVDVFSVCQE